MASSRVSVEVEGRTLQLSNQDKVLWPGPGFTKGDLVAYYRDVAAAILPHLSGRPVTLRRWPDGVDGENFFQKHAPRHRPDWVPTVELGGVAYLRLEEPAALVWAANLAAIEIHPGLATAEDLDRPSFLVLDLDPGPPAAMAECAQLALILREILDGLGRQAWAKTSGRKGLQLYVPVEPEATFARTREMALALAGQVQTDHPGRVVTEISPEARRGKVLIDWAQNAPSRTTVSVYSVRAQGRPTVSTPVTWDEVEQAAGGSADLVFDTASVRRRLDESGDLFAGVLRTR